MSMPGTCLNRVRKSVADLAGQMGRVGPICISRKLADVWKSFRNFYELSVSHTVKAFISLIACKRIGLML